MSFKVQELVQKLACPNGVWAHDLDGLLTSYFAGDRSEEEINLYRSGVSAFKWLKEDVAVVNAWQTSRGLQGLFQFPKDRHVPDCWWTDGHCKTGIEVTTALGTAGALNGMALADRGEAGGRARLMPDGDYAAIKKAFCAPREAFSTDEWVKAWVKGICKALDAKSDEKYRDMILLVAVDWESFGPEYVDLILSALPKPSRAMHAKEVYVVDRGGKGARSWQLDLQHA